MLKYIFALFACLNSHKVLNNNHNVDKIISDFEETDSPLSHKLETYEVWDLYRKKPAEADKRVLNILHELYGYDELYGGYTDEDYQAAWDSIKNKHQPLQRLPSKKKITVGEKQALEAKKRNKPKLVMTD